MTTLLQSVGVPADETSLLQDLARVADAHSSEARDSVAPACTSRIYTLTFEDCLITLFTFVQKSVG